MSHTFARIEKDQTNEQREEQQRAQRIQAQFIAEQQANQANQAKLAELQQTLQQQTSQLSSAHKKHKELASQKLAFQVTCIVAIVLFIAVVIGICLWRSRDKTSLRPKNVRNTQQVSSLMTTSFDS